MSFAGTSKLSSMPDSEHSLAVEAWARLLSGRVSAEPKVSGSEGKLSWGDSEDAVPSGGDCRPRIPPREILPWLSRRRLGSEVTFKAAQSWEGVVESAIGEDVHVRLYDKTSRSSPEEVAVIGLEEIDAEDRAFVRPGAVFYWTIGYADRPSGRQTVSVIRFRRMPVWTSSELEAVRRDADELFSRFGSE